MTGEPTFEGIVLRSLELSFSAYKAAEGDAVSKVSRDRAFDALCESLALACEVMTGVCSSDAERCAPARDVRLFDGDGSAERLFGLICSSSGICVDDIEEIARRGGRMSG